MVKNRDRQAKKLGYKDYVELGYYRMGRNCYSPEDIEVFRNGVIKYWVPFVSEFKKKQAEELGIDKIYLYDNSNVLKTGNPEPIGTVEEIFKNGKKMYEGMSKETGEFINFMLEHDLFDVIARKGKSGGGYCTEFSKYKMPFIFANFNGTFDDVDVLTHEAGHALASFEAMKNIPDPLLRQGGMETCEIHSMSMEFFAWKYMDLFFEERADDYRRMHFEHAIDFIPYGTMVDYFHQKVYEKPEMTPAERKQLWLDLESTFRPDVCMEGITYIEEGGRWQYQSHIFERPFYYIDYCLAQSVSFDFLIAMHKDYDDAFARYTSLLRKGGTKVFTDLVKEAGFDSLFSADALPNIVKALRTLEIK
jgi:M3 family oligoendopeptidase